jgi:hypothetical protein
MNGNSSGSCLCGAVSFEVEGTFEAFFLCHCEYCRKDTGSAHAANLFSAGAELRWVTGADKVTTFNLPSTRHSKCFCSICGSALPKQGDGLLAVPAGSLDSDAPIKPTAHIFCTSRAKWDDALENVPQLAKYPS